MTPDRHDATAAGGNRRRQIGLRGELLPLTEDRALDAAQRVGIQSALNKILDLELAIMLESYRHAFVANVQHAERLEREDLAALDEAAQGDQ